VPAAAVPALLIALHHPLGGVALVLLAAAVTLEWVLLMSRVKAVIARTTEGAR
jgi:hypothetical protein